MKQNHALDADRVLDALRTALAEAGDDAEFKTKLKAAISALTGDGGVAAPEPEASAPEAADEEEEAADEEEEAADEEEEAADEAAGDFETGTDDDDVSSGEELADIFNADVVAGLAIGVVAGAVLVGGGVLLHQLVRD